METKEIQELINKHKDCFENLKDIEIEYLYDNNKIKDFLHGNLKPTATKKYIYMIQTNSIDINITTMFEVMRISLKQEKLSDDHITENRFIADIIKCVAECSKYNKKKKNNE